METKAEEKSRTSKEKDKKYQLKAIWMYNDIMDLYGDKGNMMALEKRCAYHGIDFCLDTLSIGDQADLSEYDLIFIGGGADREQMMMMPDLLQRKDNLKKAMDEGSFVLLICGGYQFFGQYYLDANGNKLEGLGFFDYYTEAAQDTRRCIGNIVVKANLEGEDITLIGFENHGGQTLNNTSPIGEVLQGFGNNFESKKEGFYNGQVLGTYIHGPLLPKNSKLSDFIIYKSLKKRHPELKREEIQGDYFPFEKEARNTILNRYRLSEE